MSHYFHTIAILVENTMQQFCQWLYSSGMGTALRQSIWIFPIIETVHVLGIALLVGTVSLLDLRLLGVILKGEPVPQIARQILPLTWAGFAVMFVSGFLLFSAEAAGSYGNIAFRVKMLMIVLVGLKCASLSSQSSDSVAGPLGGRRLSDNVDRNHLRRTRHCLYPEVNTDERIACFRVVGPKQRRHLHAAVHLCV